MADLKFLENLRLIKFGPGVISKIAICYVALVAGCACLGWITGDTTFRYVTLGMMGFGFLSFVATSIYFVERHPEAAVIEGAEAIAYHELQAESKRPRYVENVSDSQGLTDKTSNRRALPRGESGSTPDVQDAKFNGD